MTPQPHTCPVWIAYLLASPLRRLLESPSTLVLPLVKPGDRVVELGPGLGYFTFPVARAVQDTGKVVCLEVQETMLRRLARRLQKRRLGDRVELRQCSPNDTGLDAEAGRYDLALAIHVLHETPSPKETLRALARCLKPAGKLLVAEPPGHCPTGLWQAEMTAAHDAGLIRVDHPAVPEKKMVALWRKP